MSDAAAPSSPLAAPREGREDRRVAGLVAVALLVLAAAALATMQVTVARLVADRRARLLATGEALATSLLDLDPYLADPFELEEARRRLTRLAGAFGLREVIVLDLGDHPLFTTAALAPVSGIEPAAVANPDELAAAWQGEASLSEPFTLEDVPFLAAFTPLRDAEGAVATVLVTVAGQAAFEELDFLRRVYAGVVGGATLLLAGLAFVGVRLRGRIRAAEAGLEHGRRLAVAGQVAAGVVHEIRNPLGIMRSTLEFLRDGPATDLAEEDRVMLADTLEEVDRIEEILERFLALARARPREPRRTRVREVLEATTRLVRRDLERRGITLQLEDRSEGAAVLLDPAGLRQALLNLVLNARDALDRREGQGGTVEIVATLDADTLEISVRDDGPGFPPEVLAEPFRAFRTGREDGTGLGLPLVERFATQAGGAARIGNRQAGGAAVTLRFPALPPEGSPADG